MKWSLKPVESFSRPGGPAPRQEVRRVFIHDIKEVEGVRQQEEQEDKRDEEIGEVEEVTHRAHET